MNLRIQYFTRSRYYNGDESNFTPSRVVVHDTGGGNNKLNRYVPDYYKYPTCGNAYDNHWDTPNALGVHAWIGLDFDNKTLATVQALPWGCCGAHAGSCMQKTTEHTVQKSYCADVSLPRLLASRFSF